MPKVVQLKPTKKTSILDDLARRVVALPEEGHTSFMVITWDDNLNATIFWHNGSGVPESCIPEFLKQTARKGLES